MPKYIDLLRSHHDPGMKDPTEPVGQDDKNAPAEEKSGDAEFDALPTENKTGKPAPQSNYLPNEDTSGVQKKPAGSDSSAQDKQWLNQCVYFTVTIFKAADKSKTCSTVELSNHIRELLASLPEQPEQLATLELMISTTVARIRKLFGELVEKSIMMMLYAIKTGIQLRLNEDEQHALVLAAMLHHIGMAQIPDSIRHKKGKLSNKELEQIRLAPKRGADYLRQCGIADARILSATSQAQERFDGSGPDGLKGPEISRTARIVGLLSMFEALIHYRSYRKRLLPRDAIREILVHHKKAFDPAFLKCLIDAISLYPVGTYVQLNSGDIGQVTLVHRRLPMRPIVRLSMDRHGNGILEREVNLQTQPNLMVERCMYKEDVDEVRLKSTGRAG